MNSGLLSDLFLFPFPHSRRLSLQHAHPEDACPRPSIESSHPSQVIRFRPVSFSRRSAGSGLKPPSADEEEEIPLDEGVQLDEDAPLDEDLQLEEEEEDVKLDEEQDVQHAHPEDAYPRPSTESSPPSQDMDKQRRSSLDEDDLPSDEEIEPLDQDNLPSYLVKRWDGVRFDYYDSRLETWDDPTPREFKFFTVKDFETACAKACEDHVREIEEDDRKSLMMALQVYTKQNNMQPTDLEFVEVKERNELLDEYAERYLHFNFLVKGLDGKQTMFFAELRLRIIDEKDVLLCTPLGEDDFKLSKENDQACCKGCEDRAKGLRHPSCGSHLVGHDEDHDEDYM